jgi:hypothetical protein
LRSHRGRIQAGFGSGMRRFDGLIIRLSARNARPPAQASRKSACYRPGNRRPVVTARVRWSLGLVDRPSTIDRIALGRGCRLGGPLVGPVAPWRRP